MKGQFPTKLFLWPIFGFIFGIGLCTNFPNILDLDSYSITLVYTSLVPALQRFTIGGTYFFCYT
jgi:hypothetical protein